MKEITQREPGLAPLLFTALSGVSLGLLLGLWLLLMEPSYRVPRAPSAEEQAKPGDYAAYHVGGRVGVVETPNLRTGLTKLERRTTGPVTFTEEELNYFFAKQPSPAVASAGEKGPPSSLEGLNFHMTGDQLFVNFKLILDPQGKRFELLVLAEVAFENTDAGPVMKVKSTKLNALPLPNLGGFVTGLASGKLAEAPLPEGMLKMWNNIRGISVVEGQLVLDVGLRRAPARS